MTEMGVQVRTLTWFQRRRRSEWAAAHVMGRHIFNAQIKGKRKLEAAMQSLALSVTPRLTIGVAQAIAVAQG